MLDTCIFDRIDSSGKDIIENRPIKINFYPGTNNYSQFTYDGEGRAVQILETLAGTVSSTRQFVWCKDKVQPYQPCEARNASGAITSQYFLKGETINCANYFYTTDHISLTPSTMFAQVANADTFSVVSPLRQAGSVREMTDSSGNIQAQYQYDPFGRVTKVQGSLASDFQWAGYYYHGPSGLSNTVYRLYSAALGRWTNRDPVGEIGDSNLYCYVHNEPIGHVDPLGLISGDTGIGGYGDCVAACWAAHGNGSLASLARCLDYCNRRYGGGNKNNNYPGGNDNGSDDKDGRKPHCPGPYTAFNRRYGEHW